MTLRSTARRLVPALLVLALALGAVSCGSDDDGDAAATTAAEATAAFPVTIEHAHGSTTIEQEPQRVVSVGFTEQDPLLALGVVPVGVREFFGEKPDATFTWAHDLLGGATPEVLSPNEIEVEKVAALRPDLIVATYAGLTDAQYTQLSRFAPVITQPVGAPDYGTPWQDQTRLIATAVGRSERAEELIADVEARIARARAETPGLDGAVALAAYPNGDGTYGVFTANDPRGELLADLGTTRPPEAVALGDDDYFADFSGERMAIVDGDALFWFGDAPTIEGNRIYEGLRVAKEGRTLILPDASDMSGAMSFSTVLSIPWFLDEMDSRWEPLLDGDPATEPAPAI